MKFKIMILVIGFLGYMNLIPCETVNFIHSFIPGEGQSSGQSDEYFPENIFGLPSNKGSEKSAETSPEEIASLGLGGEIVIGNSEFLIVDGEGADFTIFENVFMNPINNKPFAEPGVVSASKDGVNFTEFPYDSQTLEGCAGVTPTYGSKDACDPSESGGDSFDLSDIGLDSIRYIKIRDITEQIKRDKSHPYYDPVLSGFDLDAVVIHNYVADKITNISEQKLKSKCYYEINNGILHSKKNRNIVFIYSLNGRILNILKGVNTMNLKDLKEKALFIKIQNKEKVFYEKIINL